MAAELCCGRRRSRSYLHRSRDGRSLAYAHDGCFCSYAHEMANDYGTLASESEASLPSLPRLPYLAVAC